MCQVSIFATFFFFCEILRKKKVFFFHPNVNSNTFQFLRLRVENGAEILVIFFNYFCFLLKNNLNFEKIPTVFFSAFCRFMELTPYFIIKKNCKQEHEICDFF